MNRVALMMLVGDRAKYIAIIMGIVFASMLITQQEAIFCGLMARTISAITDLGLPEIWVMDPKVQFIDDVKPLQDTQLTRVRGIEGVEWAVPLYKGMLKARLGNGNFQNCNVLGLDDATLIGGPPIMIQGNIADLRRAEAIIVDEVGARGKLAKRELDGTSVPLRVGDTMELNDHRATVVGICRVTRTFQSQPVVYTTYSRAVTFAPQERKLLSFVLVKAKPGVDRAELCDRIRRTTGLAARTREEFKWLTIGYFLRYTGIPINIGIGVIMSFLVGTAIAGQTFYSFTLDNLRHFGALKAMGASNGRLLGMIILQAVVVGVIGYGIGVGAAATVGRVFSRTELAFLLLWQALAITGGAVVLICILASVLSIRKVMKLEPAIVFKN
ncbi:MAG: FtsX-like permease family protein [Planctomycetes bacterium]|nr:FtsX-like permease family protein [Planctomycetota bacterium]